MQDLRSRTSALRNAVAALAVAAGLFAAGGAHAAMVNCAQTVEDHGMNAEDFLHFDGSENCFGDPDARFLGYSVLLQNDSETSCDATLSGGVFAAEKWHWSGSTTVHFNPFEKKEVYYDLSTETNITVGQIQLLHSGRGLITQCDRNLLVRYTLEDPLPAQGTYFNLQGEEGYFKIFSEDFIRHPRTNGAVLGRTIVRLPKDGVYGSRGVLSYEFYTDVRRSQFPLDPGKKDDPTDDEKFYSQYHLEKWNEAASTWETVLVSGPRDVSAVPVRCADDSPDCYGDKGVLKRVFGDGYYRLRARHFWRRRGWMEWSSWRVISVNFRTPLLATPVIERGWFSNFKLWLYDDLLGWGR